MADGKKVQNCTFFVQLTLLYGVLKICKFFGTPMAPKKLQEPFFSQIKISEMQKSVFELFLSKSKILKRLNHRITENSQNCSKKIRNF